MRRILLTLLLLPASFGIAQPPDPFAWGVIEGVGCYVPGNGQPKYTCQEYWAFHSSRYCLATCEPKDGGLKCKINPAMHFERKGPDLDAEVPSLRQAFTMPNDNSPGNKPRKRMLQCVRDGNCVCVFQDIYNNYHCKYSNVVTYEHRGTYAGDLMGPACPDPRPPQGGGSSGGGSSGGGSSGGGSQGGGYFDDDLHDEGSFEDADSGDDGYWDDALLGDNDGGE